MLLYTSFFNRAGPAGATDPDFSSVVLLCSFEGADAATTATDDSPLAHTLSFVGNAQIDTDQKYFGASSLLLDGASDRVTAPAGTSWDFGSGQFTVEFFVRFATLTSTNRGMIGAGGSASNRSWGANVASGLASFGFAFSSDGGASYNNSFTTSGVTPATDTWYHICIDRDGSNKFRMYIDGVMRGSMTTANAINYETTALGIGDLDASGSTDMNGWIDEIRITKGVARYASDSGFTVPTSAYPRS